MSDARLSAEGVIVERDDVAVMFKRVTDDQDEIIRGWTELEAALGSMHGRKFYGAFGAPAGEYRVCVKMRQDDRPEEIGLDLGTLPGGRYVRVTLRGEPPAVLRTHRADLSAPGEARRRRPEPPRHDFYRRRGTIDLLLPVS